MSSKNHQFIKDTFGWGFLLWLIGYLLGFIFFFIVPPAMIGWMIAPIGTAITLLVLFKKIQREDFKHYLMIAMVWTPLAVVLDYLLIVKLLNPVGYYKPAVYLYYGLTFSLPLLVGYMKMEKK